MSDEEDFIIESDEHEDVEPIHEGKDEETTRKKERRAFKISKRFVVNIEDIQKKIDGEEGFIEDISLDEWKARRLSIISLCCLIPKFVINVLMVLGNQIRERRFVLLACVALIVSEPVVGVPLFFLAFLYFFLEAIIYTIVFSLIFLTDMHSFFRTIVRYELFRTSRCYKWSICTSHVLVLTILVIIYLSITAYELESGTRSFFFRTSFGDCSCVVPFLSQPSTGSFYFDWYDWIRSVVTHFFAILIAQVLLVVGFLFFYHVEMIMSHESPVSYRVNKYLGWPLNKHQIPELQNFTLCHLLFWRPDTILISIHWMIFLVESDKEVKRLSKLQSFSHLKWSLLRGMKTPEILLIRNFFFDSRGDEHKKSCNFCYQNQRCCCIRLCCVCQFCYFWCCLCQVYRCVKNIYDHVEKKQGRGRSSIKDQIKDHKEFQRQQVLSRYRGLKENSTKSALKCDQLMTIKKELNEVLFDVDLKLLQLYRRVHHFRKLNFVQVNWKKYVKLEGRMPKSTKGPKNVSIRLPNIKVPSNILTAKSDKRLGSKLLRTEEKWIDRVVNKTKKLGDLKTVATKLVRIHEYLGTRYSRLLAMRRALDYEIDRVEEKSLFEEFQMEKIYVDSQRREEELEGELELEEIKLMEERNDKNTMGSFVREVFNAKSSKSGSQKKEFLGDIMESPHYTPGIDKEEDEEEIDPDRILADLPEEEEGEEENEGEEDDFDSGEGFDFEVDSNDEYEVEGGLLDLTRSGSVTLNKRKLEKARRNQHLLDLDLNSVSLRVAKRREQQKENVEKEIFVETTRKEEEEEDSSSSVSQRSDQQEEIEEKKDGDSKEEEELNEEDFEIVRESFASPLMLDSNVHMSDENFNSNPLKSISHFTLRVLQKNNINSLGRSLKGISYITFLHFKFRIVFLAIIITFFFTHIPFLVVVSILLIIEFSISTCLMICCRCRDLQSLLRIMMHWEYYRENRCVKVYHLLVLLTVCIFGIISLFNIEFLVKDDNYLFGYSIFRRTGTLRNSVYYTADLLCDECSPSHGDRKGEKFNPKESFYYNNGNDTGRFFAHGYFWLFALIPLIKWTIVSLVLCVGRGREVMLFSGPGCVRYRNQIASGREKSFETYSGRFPGINVKIGTILWNTPAEIIEKMLAALYFVRSEKDVASFSKIASLRHLEWGLLKGLDDEWVKDLRSFFFRRVELEDEIPRGKRCQDFKNWISSDQSCCLLVLCCNVLCSCSMFGRYVENVKKLTFLDMKENIEELVTESENLTVYLKRGQGKIRKRNNIISELETAYEELKGDVQENIELEVTCQEMLEACEATMSKKDEALLEIKAREERLFKRVTDITKELRKMKKAKKKFDLLTSEKDKRESEYVALLNKVRGKDLSYKSEKEEIIEINKMLKEGEEKVFSNATELFAKYKNIVDQKKSLELEINQKERDKEVSKEEIDAKERITIKKIRRLGKLAKKLQRKYRASKKKWMQSSLEKEMWKEKKEKLTKEIERLEKENKELLREKNVSGED